MAAVQPAGPLPRMMTLECLGVLLVMVCFWALRLARVWPCHMVMAVGRVKPHQKLSRCIRLECPVLAQRFCLQRCDSRNIIAGGPRPRYDAPPEKGACVDTRKLDA